METLLKNLRYAFRSLRKHPLFTAVALLTLALGIGANTAIFSLVRAVLLAPLPYDQPERIVQVWPERPVSIEQALAFEAGPTNEEGGGSFSAIAPYTTIHVALTGDGRPERLVGLEVGHRYFDVLAASPALGRGFTELDHRPGASSVAILSHRLWQTRFGGEANILGKMLRLDGTERQVVGVLAESFQAMVPTTDVWLPVVHDANSELYRDWAVYRLLGRLAPGASIARAQEQARQVVAGLHRQMPDYVAADAHESATVVPLLDRLVGDVRQALWLLLGAVMLVLVVACTNVANLMLARSRARERELALRSALGAGRRHLFAQVMTESVVLALAGGLLGTLAAAWTVSLLSSSLASSLPRLEGLAVDGPVLAFAIAVSVISGLFFGLVPAIRSTGRDLLSILQRAGRGGSGGRLLGGHGLHGVLVAAEIAVSMVLVIGAGLLVKSFWQVQQVDLGFRPERVLTFNMQPDGESFADGERRGALFEQVAERLAALPGVDSVGGISRLPATPGDVRVPIMAEDRPLPPGERAPWTSVRIVTPGGLETLGVPLLAGRGLTAADRAETMKVGLVNRTLARRIWGEESPIGKELLYDDGSAFFTVVGLVADMRHHRLDQAPVPQVYVPVSQESWATQMAFALRLSQNGDRRGGAAGTGGASGGGLVSAVEGVVWAADANATLTQVRTMDEVVSRALVDRRHLLGLFSFFAALALVLGAVGVYGVTAYLVSQRVRETAIRMALGADDGAVIRGSLARMLAPVGLGLLTGWIAAFGLTRLLRGLLFDVRPSDPGVFVAVALCLAAVAALAGYLPARRASRVDPMRLLRVD